MRIYFDACCVNRPFDDQTQDRVRLETEAVMLILGRIQAGMWQWIGSDVLAFELGEIPDPNRKRRVMRLTRLVQHVVSHRGRELARAVQLEGLGFDAFDALHVACAESVHADVLLTTDDDLLRRADRFSTQLGVRVANPVIWLREVQEP